MPELSKRKKTELVKQANAAFAARNKAQDAANKKIRRTQHTVGVARRKRQLRLLDKLAREAGFKLAGLQAEHDKGNERIKSTVASERNKLEKTIRKDLANRRRIRSHIRKLRDDHYEVVRPNPGTLICDWFADGHEEQVLDRRNEPQTDYDLEWVLGELGENHIRTRLWAGRDAYIETRHTLAFTWVPEGPGTATISTFFAPAGILASVAGSGCGPAYSGVAQVVAFTEVFIVAAGRPVLFPRKKEVVAGIFTTEGESALRKATTETSLTYQSIPIVPNTFVVVRAGIECFASSLGNASAEIDFSSKSNYGFNVPSVWITHQH